MKPAKPYLALVFASSCMLSACLNALPPEGEIVCTPGDVSTCPSGWSCWSDRRCHSNAEPADAGRDAGADLDAYAVFDAHAVLDAQALDADAHPIDAQVADVGNDAPVDAPPDANTDARASERCTASESGALGEDEDRDGAIDEGCPFFFGRPHPVMTLVSGFAGRTRADTDYTESTRPEISADGSTLTYASYQGGFIPMTQIRRLTRGDRSMPFGPFDTIAIDGLPSGARVLSLVSARDGLTGLVAYIDGFSNRIAPVVRSAASTSWMANTSRAWDGREPTISADGLEAFYVTTDIKRTSRTSLTTAWTAGLSVGGLPMNAAGPHISDDGNLLFFHVGTSPSRINVAERTDVSSFGASSALDLGASATEDDWYPTYNAATRELFFATNRAWNPSFGPSIWRVQVCRDAPCSAGPQEQIDCTGSAQLRSPDGLHCYEALGGMRAQGAARDECTMSGGHLATIHSDAELTAVSTRLPASASVGWVDFTDAATEGSWVWGTGEVRSYVPFLFFIDGMPMDEDCAVASGIAFQDRTCTESNVAVCERELWPTW